MILSQSDLGRLAVMTDSFSASGMGYQQGERYLQTYTISPPDSDGKCQVKVTSKDADTNEHMSSISMNIKKDELVLLQETARYCIPRVTGFDAVFEHGHTERKNGNPGY